MFFDYLCFLVHIVFGMNINHAFLLFWFVFHIARLLSEALNLSEGFKFR